MLRNTRIRTRLAVMAIGPVIPVLVILGLVAAMLPKVMITGPTYRQILAGEQFIADAGTMQLSVARVHILVQRLATQQDNVAVQKRVRNEISAHWRNYTTTYNSWEGGRLTDAEARKGLQESDDAAKSYMRLYTERFIPALENKTLRMETAADVLHNQMAAAMQRQEAALDDAKNRIVQQVEAQEEAVTQQLPIRVVGVIGVTLLVVAAGIGLSVTVLRSITDRVRRLSDVATIELPKVLEDVKRAALAGEEIPSLPVPKGDDRDELTAAAAAFNSVIATAVDLAAEQSRIRRATAQMFVNLGRRNHKLLSRTLTYITQLESDERDPGTLQNLFRLDHLTTRMRRHAESLLVLAGSPSLRTWSRPVPVADVLRAALSEIETYDRVDIKELEPVEVRGASVSDLAHLLAELLENATAFSPPQTRVRVLGRTDSDGYTVVVVDEGIGMSGQELEAANQLINTPDGSGFLGDSRMLGLGVVGRLAARHGFRVNLTASPVGGVVAWVTLPSTALAPRRSSDADPVGGSLLNTPESLPRQAGQPTPSILQPRGAEAAETLTANSRQTADGGAPPLPAHPTSRDRQREAGSAPPEAPTAPPEIREPAAGGEGTGRAPLEPVPAPLSTPAPLIPAAYAPTPVDDHGQGEDAVPQPFAETVNGATGAILLPPRAPEVPGPTSGPVIIPPAPEKSPVSGPIAFRRPAVPPGEPSGLTRRIRGAQLPDTGEKPATTTEAPRPQRTAQSVRGALQSFDAGRRTASEVTLGNVRPVSGPLPTRGPGSGREDDTPTKPQPTLAGAARLVVPPAHPQNPAPAVSAMSAAVQAGGEPIVEPSGQPLPRRVRGAQMPETDLPSSAPAPGRTAADVRAALSNFVAGRRAATEHED